VPGEVAVPTGEIAVVRDGGPTAGVTGIETVGELDGADCPAVAAVAVGDTGPVAPAGMFTPMLTGGKLAPGCTGASVVHVTCWPLTEHCHPLPAADVTVCPAGTLNTSVVVPVVGPAFAALLTFAWYVPVPGELKVPTAEIVVASDGGDEAGGVGLPEGVLPPAGATGTDTPGALEGADWPVVVAVAVGDAGPVALAGMLALIVTGGKLSPGCTTADDVQVTCWPLVEHVQPLPVAPVAVWPAGTLKTSVVVPDVGPASGASLTLAWYVALPGEVNVPTGEIVVVTRGDGAALTSILSVAVLLEGTCWSGLLAVTVTGIVPDAEAAIDVVIAIGG
jgi:hypothetical protein